MRIEDIARLAGVSISTVSKIVNGKDGAFSAQTRERVLAIVKEYNYIPYSTVINNLNAKNFLIGLLVANRNHADCTQAILSGVVAQAQKNNYAVLICDSEGNVDQETKNITMLCRNRVDGVLWEGLDNEKVSGKEIFFGENIPVIPFGALGGTQFAIDYRKLGYNAAHILVERGHMRIGCVGEMGNENSQHFWQGVSRCLTENGISIDDEQGVIDSRNMDGKIFERRFTAFACVNEKCAGEIKRLAYLQRLGIPEDISVIALCARADNPFVGEISMLMLPLREYGEVICEHLISVLEKRSENEFAFSWEGIKPDSGASLSMPYNSNQKSILVVGSVNVDVLLNMDELPQVGKTVVADNMTTIPGGKGLNQAVGAAKLGANVSLIARVGVDYEGAGIYVLLQENKIDSRGVMRDESQSTGKAYIYVRPDGDSSIIVYAGANKNLRPADIEANEKLFETAGYCLLPMELSIKTVGAALKMAKRHNVKTILKPSTLRSIPDEFLKLVDYFVPNEAEANSLCPEVKSIREKAESFLAKGAGTVIITLGAKGCYVNDGEKERLYEAAPVKVVDTTGGADAFISALAVSLNEGYPLDAAVDYATLAAGFCVSRHGTLPAMVDRMTLELSMPSESKKKD